MSLSRRACGSVASLFSPPIVTALLSTAAALGVAPSAIAQATLNVQGYGVDGPSCGTRAAPCRSITRAIALAQAGDTILVGPGRYGDVDRDAVFDPGDEGPPRRIDDETSATVPVVRIDKPVRVLSTHGAEVTTIDAGLGIPLENGRRTALLGVGIRSSDVVFGSVGHGFRIPTSGEPSYRHGGIGLDFFFPVHNVKIAGNIVEGRRGPDGPEGGGITVQGAASSVLIADNQVVGGGGGIGISFRSRDGNFIGGPVTVLRNTVRGNLRGVDLAGKGITLSGNIVEGNIDTGIFANDDDATEEPDADTRRISIDHNYVVGNGHGLVLATVGAVTSNAIIGNVRGGLVKAANHAIARLELNNFYGNGVLPSDGLTDLFPPSFPTNCAILFDDSDRTYPDHEDILQLVARNNYWGAATGPGPDPADDSGGAGQPCNVVSPPVVDTPFATAPFDVPIPVKPAAPRG